MTLIRESRESDERHLKILYMREVEMIGNADVAKRLGISKGAAAGAYHRYERTPRLECHCTKPENQDGGMPAKWWAK